MKSSKRYWVVTILSLGLATVHASGFVKIDAIALILLATAALPWVVPLIHSVKVGDTEIRLRDVKRLEEKAEKSGLVKILPEVDKEKKRHIYAFETIVGDDPKLLVIGFMEEIEERLKRIADSRNLMEEGDTLWVILHKLTRSNILSAGEVSTVSSIMALLDSAAHGAVVDDHAREWMKEFGPRLLLALEERIGETSVPKLLEQWKKRDGAMGSAISPELSKALVQSPKAFLACMKEDRESFDSWLQSIDSCTFTIFEDGNEVEEEMHIASYERLKELMIEAMEPLVGGEFDEDARRVIEILQKVEIHRIW